MCTKLFHATHKTNHSLWYYKVLVLVLTLNLQARPHGNHWEARRAMPIIWTPETIAAVKLLLKERPPSIPKSNKYQFKRASKGSVEHLHGWDCVLPNVKKLKEIKKPEEMTSMKLWKNIATITQTTALTEVNMDWLARCLGHDIRIHQQFNQLHESTTELAKVSKLLLAVDSGNTYHLSQGRLL